MRGGTRPGAGRPPVGPEAKRRRLELRVTDEQHGRWREAADRAGVESLSEWIAETLDSAAGADQRSSGGGS